jgi:hypothetical protein
VSARAVLRLLPGGGAVIGNDWVSQLHEAAARILAFLHPDGTLTPESPRLTPDEHLICRLNDRSGKGNAIVQAAKIRTDMVGERALPVDGDSPQVLGKGAVRPVLARVAWLRRGGR